VGEPAGGHLGAAGNPAPPARDSRRAADVVRLLEQAHRGALLGGGEGCYQSRRAGAEHHDVELRLSRRGGGHAAAARPPWPGWTTVTVPAVPSTVTRAPSGILEVESCTDTTQGIPSSRATTMAWLLIAPRSTTTAPATRNSGVHAASVNGATRTSPG